MYNFGIRYIIIVANINVQVLNQTIILHVFEASAVHFGVSHGFIRKRVLGKD